MLALPGGEVEEVVQNGISGFICQSAGEMVERARALPGAFKPANVRQYCQQYFSVDRMVADYVALYQELFAEKNLVGKATARIPMIA